MDRQMKLAGQGECLFSHTGSVAIVHRDKSGMVSPLWLCACKEERSATEGLMEKVADPLNLQRAYRKVRANNGSGGVDGMEVKELGKWLSGNWEKLQADLLQCKYKPSAVRGVSIPKPQGGYRQLGIPTVKDRLIQQAIHQVLIERYECIFSDNSYGFRPSRNAHQALKRAAEYASEGRRYVIDLDLEKFFDEVNHDRLLWLLSTRIGDKRLLKLINEFVRSGILTGGLSSQRTKGTPQGSPLSPLLSNIVLDELDKELERRGHHYVRYADDVKIFVSSEQAAIRVKSSISKYIEKKMQLKVNQAKSRVCKSQELNFLGHSILWKGRLGLSQQSEDRLKRKVRQITRRNRGISIEQMIKELRKSLEGWLLYFRYATMKGKMERIDGWIKRKLRCHRLKQCKRTIGIVRWLRKLHVEERLCWRTALSGKGWWRLANSPALSMGMSNEWFYLHGYFSLHNNYQALHCKLL